MTQARIKQPLRETHTQHVDRQLNADNFTEPCCLSTNSKKSHNPHVDYVERTEELEKCKQNKHKSSTHLGSNQPQSIELSKHTLI